MQRFDPDAIPATPDQLAAPTMERGQHYLFHTQPGDIWGGYSGPATDPAATLVANWLTIAQCSLMREAKRILAEVQTAIPRAKITAWLKGERSKSMWCVHIPDVTPAEVERAQPFIVRPAPKRSATEKRVSLTQNAPQRAAQRTMRSVTAPLRCNTAAQAATPATVSATVSAMNATVFAFLLSTAAEPVDPDTAAAVQRCFVTHLQHAEATRPIRDWRAEFAAWWATQNAPQKPATPAPAPQPATPPQPVTPPAPRRTAADALAALRRKL